MVKPSQNVIFERSVTQIFFQEICSSGGKQTTQSFSSFHCQKLKGTYHNFVVHAPTIMKLGTDMKLDVLYKMVTKHFVTMLLLSNYDAITGIYADV